MKTTPITELIATWRSRSADGYSLVLLTCADELEALLPKLDEAEVSPARRGDPATSKAAARNISADNLRGKFALAFYKDRIVYPESHGLSAQGATRRARMEHLASPWKRISELKAQGIVEATGETVIGPRGQKQEVLRLTDHGLAECERIMPDECTMIRALRNGVTS